MTTTITFTTTLLVTLGQWFILEKMGEKGWKAVIPFYGTYLLFKHAWDTKMYWISIALTAAALVSGLAAIALAFSGNVPACTAAFVLTIAIFVALFALELKFMYELSKRFGHGAGYTAGMFFLNPIFTLALGLGKDKFIEA